MLGGKALDVGGTIRILPRHSTEGYNCIHHSLGVRIDDREIQPDVHRLYEEVFRHVPACGQAEGNIADTERTVQSETLVHLAHGTQRLHRLCLLRRYSEGQAVDDDVLALQSVLLRLRHNTLGDGDALRRRLGQPFLVHRKSEYCRPVMLCEREDGIHTFTFTADRVDDDASVRDAQSRLDYLRVRRVDLQGKVDNALHRLDNVRDNLLLVHALCADIDVKHLRARFLLGNREFLDIAVVLLEERLLEALLARRIDALADNIELAVFRDTPR